MIFAQIIQWGGHPQHAAKECSVLPIGTDMVRSCFSEILSLKLRGPDQAPKYLQGKWETGGRMAGETVIKS